MDRRREISAVVRRMVPAQRSGVMVTADPVTGDTDLTATCGPAEWTVHPAVDRVPVVPGSNRPGDRAARSPGSPTCRVAAAFAQQRQACCRRSHGLPPGAGGAPRLRG
ncbi:hypothetical protein [Actinokineospora terrae]|uniref:hypothetical protein n=1 Tax=Actinokineospora terrae TaxID=155974 RepID=UPI001160BF61|nr:hypothetical protein [Actinokineospora terrae]